MSRIGTGPGGARLLLSTALLLPAMGLAIAQPEPTPADTETQSVAADAVDEVPDDANAGPSSPIAHPDGYSDLRRISPVQGNAAAGQAKSELCAACHGPTGISVVPIYPNLAGQSATYLYWELMQFKRGRLPDSPMTALVSELSEQEMRDFAAYYASLDPAAAAAATEPEEAGSEAEATTDPQRLQRGEQLYLSGDPGKGIPACQGCHGADARGHPDALKPDRNGHTPYAVYPALRGQQVAYLQNRLGEYHSRTLHDSTTDFVMQGVAQRLDEDSIQSLTEWLSSLPH